jgi:Uma2 family endonuclease
MAIATLASPIATALPVSSAEPIAVERRLFTTDEYHRMIEVGILRPDDKVELIQGEILKMAPMEGPHIYCLGTLTRLLAGQLDVDVRIHIQMPVQLPDLSEPEPDVSLVRATYDIRLAPKVADVLLVMEVSDTSRRFDRFIKLPLYAAAGIPETWIYDVNARHVERFSDPTPDGYATVQLAGRGETLVSTVLPAVRIVVDEIFGPVETSADDSPREG